MSDNVELKIAAMRKRAALEREFAAVNGSVRQSRNRWTCSQCSTLIVRGELYFELRDGPQWKPTYERLHIACARESFGTTPAAAAAVDLGEDRKITIKT